MCAGKLPFWRRPDIGGPLCLLLMACAGLVMANTPLRGLYALCAVPLGTFAPFAHMVPSWGRGVLNMTFSELISSGPMALFFLMMALELKRELVVGHLASLRAALLPCVSACGGVVAPALIYKLIIGHESVLQPGWAIPVATDAAFTLPVLLALGRHVSQAGRIWLMALAIFDDVIGILIIALFYGGTLHLLPAMGALLCTGIMAIAGWRRIGWLWVYAVGGVLLWGCMMASGLHPTLAGVIVGLCVPLQGGGMGSGATSSLPVPSPLKRLEQGLAPWVTWVILPLFAFVTVGIPLHMGASVPFNMRLSLAVASGLVVGKSCGIFGVTWAVTRWGLAPMPAQTSPYMLFGLCLLGGIGFTVSLFMASLSFKTPELLISAKLGILLGSCFAALLGWLWLRLGCRAATAVMKEQR